MEQTLRTGWLHTALAVSLLYILGGSAPHRRALDTATAAPRLETVAGGVRTTTELSYEPAAQHPPGLWETKPVAATSSALRPAGAAPVRGQCAAEQGGHLADRQSGLTAVGVRAYTWPIGRHRGWWPGCQARQPIGDALRCACLARRRIGLCPCDVTARRSVVLERRMPDSGKPDVSVLVLCRATHPSSTRDPSGAHRRWSAAQQTDEEDNAPWSRLHALAHVYAQRWPFSSCCSRPSPRSASWAAPPRTPRRRFPTGAR
jgi:hypothetical protein